MSQQCPKCRSNDKVTVQLRLDGSDVTFSHCRACEERWYTTAGGQERLTLDEVLELVAV